MVSTERQNVGVIGAPAQRIDGHAKVTGEARYASDQPVANPAYAFLVTSSIARGSVQKFHLDEARAVKGVLDILNYENVGDRVKPHPGPDGGKSPTSMQSAKVWHDGQIIAVVIADTFEAAREAAHKVRVAYADEQPAAGFDSPGAETEALSEAKGHEDPHVGDAEGAFQGAEVKIEAEYSTPTQHHNPMELFATTCAWSDGKLTIYEGSQFVGGLQHGIARQLGMQAKDVHVVSPFVGGAFGSRGGVTSRTAWIALASKRLNRPVKLVATRDQGFTIATYRAETRHRIKLAAARDGKLQALVHEGMEVTSRPSNYAVAGTDTTARLYACPNVATKVSIVHADRNTPGYMRAPPEQPYMYPLESAMDELAVALDMDPVELRRVNDTKKEPIKGLPYTSRSLMPCFDAAAAAFGWSKRDPKPGSMRDGDWLIGWGCASVTYPSNIGPAAARVILSADGRARVQIAAEDMGQGSYTAIGLTAADRLGLPLEKVSVEIGDSDLPPGNLAAGSSHTASVCNAVAKACDQIREKIASAAIVANDGRLSGRDAGTLILSQASLQAPDGTSEPLRRAVQRVGGVVEAYAENTPPEMGPDAMQKLYDGRVVLTGGSELKDRVQYAFGAEFVEVRVHARTREIRVPRMVGAFAAGTIVNPLTARNQLIGGMIWGIGSALHEETQIDTRHARYVNTDISEYLIPVNADVETVDAILIPEEDKLVNPLGIKGLGELGNAGTAAAVANAVYHATGKRIRTLPIRLEQLL